MYILYIYTSDIVRIDDAVQFILGRLKRWRTNTRGALPSVLGDAQPGQAAALVSAVAPGNRSARLDREWMDLGKKFGSGLCGGNCASWSR